MNLIRKPATAITALTIGVTAVVFMHAGAGNGAANPARTSPLPVLAAVSPASLVVPPAKAALEPMAQLPATFIENRGQFDPEARFVVRQGATATYLTPDRFVVQAVQPNPAGGEAAVRGVNLFFTFEGAATDARIDGVARLDGRMNYLLGNDPAKWVTDVPTWSAVRATGIYDGIDVAFRDSAGRVEYDLFIGRNADPSKVVLRCDGAEALSLDESGALVASTAVGTIRQECPVTWRVGPNGERENVECRFRLIDDRRFGFDVPDHRPGEALVIDPVIVFSGIVGGSSYDVARAISIDPTGAMFLTGRTASTNFPHSAGAFDGVLNNTEAFVTKIAAGGGSVVYSTYLGSPGADQAFAMTLDSQGRAIITGQCGSGFPTTAGTYDTSQNGWSDTFVSKLNATGTGLVFSTFVGGNNDDYPGGIDVDGSDNVYVTGATKSTNFPTTAGAYDSTPNGDWDGFLVKLAASGASLLLGTRFGGTLMDSGVGVRVTPSGQIVVAGATSSTDFPTVAGAFDTTQNGASDAFVCKFSASGAQLLWGTFLGGAGNDQALALEVDAQDCAIITGQAYDGYPVTSGAIRTSTQLGADAFVTKVAANGQSLVYSTFIGGASSDAGYALALDVNGAPVVVGYTNSVDLGVSANAVQSAFLGGGVPGDGFVTKLSVDGSSVVFSTFVGGAGSDQIKGVALDSLGAIFITGTTTSSSLGALTPSMAAPQGLDDCFFMKLTLGPAAVVSPIGPGCSSGGVVPTLSSGLPVVGGTITTSGTSAPPLAYGDLVFSGAAGATTLPNGCPLYVDPVTFATQGHFQVGANGTWSVTGIVPNAESLVGDLFSLQAVFLSPSAPGGYTVSAGVQLALGY